MNVLERMRLERRITWAILLAAVAFSAACQMFFHSPDNTPSPPPVTREMQ